MQLLEKIQVILKREKMEIYVAKVIIRISLLLILLWEYEELQLRKPTSFNGNMIWQSWWKMMMIIIMKNITVQRYDPFLKFFAAAVAFFIGIHESYFRMKKRTFWPKIPSPPSNHPYLPLLLLLLCFLLYCLGMIVL